MLALEMATKSCSKEPSQSQSCIPKVKDDNRWTHLKLKLPKVTVFKVEVAEVHVFKVKVAKVLLDVFLMHNDGQWRRLLLQMNTHGIRYVCYH